jgi:hypothetical protein
MLRRLSQALRRQDWATIAIEFVLLVLGVFLGIQVANWNAEREDRRKGDGFARKLVADMRAEHWRYRFLLEYHRDVHAAAESTLGALNGTAPLPDAALLVQAYRASQYKQGASSRATYDELVSTGNLGLIADERLRQVAGRLYSITTIDNLVNEGLQSAYRRWYRMHIPNDVQRALSKACGDRYIQPGDYREFDHVIDYPCTPELADAAVSAAARLLREDPQVVPYLQLRIADLDTRLTDMTQNNRDILEGLREFAAEGP